MGADRGLRAGRTEPVIAPEFSQFVAEDSARLIAAVKKIGRVE